MSTTASPLSEPRTGPGAGRAARPAGRRAAPGAPSAVRFAARGGRRAWLAAAASIVAGAFLVAAAVPAAAEEAAESGSEDAVTSSLQIVPEAPEPQGGDGAGPGPTSCAQLAVRYGDGTKWHEIRFATVPAVGASKTASAAGVTATVTRLSPGTLSFVATAGISLVFVNAGSYPHESNAVFKYDPPSRGASGLSGTVPSDIIDHVLLCFGTVPASTAPATTVPATTAPPTTTPATTVAATTTPAAVVRAHATARPAVPAITPGQPATPPALPRLPETGAGTNATGLAGVGLVVLGAVAMALARTRRPEAR